jgi:hypothetical protein
LLCFYNKVINNVIEFNYKIWGGINMQCKKCGNSVTEKEKFCCECGTKIEHEALCNGCGSRLKLGAKFCSVCGQNVVEINEVPTIPVASTNSTTTKSPNKIFTSCEAEKCVFNDCAHILYGFTEIGKEAFMERKDITSVEIPPTIKSIGDRAFYGCENLIRVIIPKSVTSVGEDAFYGCNNIKQVFRDSDANKLEGDNIIIPWGFTEIEESAFSERNDIKSVILPDSIKIIGDRAFAACKNLTSITIPEGVIRIERYAFFACYNLVNAKIPNSVTHIGEYAFFSCLSLTSLTIPSNIRSIEENVFNCCYGLTEVIIPNSVTNIGSSFCECKNLTSITIPDSVKKIGDLAFNECPLLVVTCSLDSYAYKYCKKHKMKMNNEHEYGKQIVTQKSVASTTAPKIGIGIASPKVLNTYTTPRLTKAQSEKLSDAEKKILPKLKKDQGFILYDNERNLFFMQRDNWSRIEVIKPSDITNPVARYTLPKELGNIKPQYSFRWFLFYTNIDAFIAWGDYIFLSVYNGQICWTAADSRDEDKLPGGKANQIIHCSGGGELELLPNGNVKIGFGFRGGITEYRLEKGVLIPCN